MLKLEGKVALVTGGGRGIGRSIALKLASEGARMVVNDLDAGPVHDVVEEIRQLGGTAVACAGSVVDEEFSARFVKTATDHYQGLDIIINNAGYTWDNVIQKMSDEQWHAILDVHLTAPFRILRAAQPVIRALSKAEAEAGREVFRKVVNISSLSATCGNAGQANYSAAKAGIVGMTKTLAKEWGRMKVNVNCVAFGLIKTRLLEVADGIANVDIAGRNLRIGVNPDVMKNFERSVPLGRTGTPEEAAGAVYLLCTPESNYITGQTVVCAGGISV